ncbi:CLUMA_CG020904, isoform A [Clunio marinus]|uniref:CLUMA_CG020904, isoform A n=1 Tax=Clunio marinus TaxID=568069 RepID=A0A1J1J9A6_9DIPT|nr:CLUMA_CG020904, isoform A [Clunio marinus]
MRKTSKSPQLILQETPRNKRKKFNPQCLQKESIKEDMDKEDGNKIFSSMIFNGDTEKGKSFFTDTFSLSKDNSKMFANHQTSNHQTIKNKVFTKFHSNYQQLLGDAAVGNNANRVNELLNSNMDVNDSEMKLKEFAVITMEELLKLYGLSFPQKEIIDAIQKTKIDLLLSSTCTQQNLEPPTPPRTPVLNNSVKSEIDEKTILENKFSNYFEDFSGLEGSSSGSQVKAVDENSSDYAMPYIGLYGLNPKSSSKSQTTNIVDHQAERQLIEKHKTYHMKDEQLLKDGFQKYLKSEACKIQGCRFSTICNHIHCTRHNCSYVLHSSSQLLSHKRKHERLDAELSQRKFRAEGSVIDFNAQELAVLQSYQNLDLWPKSTVASNMKKNLVSDHAITEKFNKLLNNSSLESLNILLNQAPAKQSNISEKLRQDDNNLLKYDTSSVEKDQNENDYEHTNLKSMGQNVNTQKNSIIHKETDEIENIVSQYFSDFCTKQQQKQDDKPLNLDIKSSEKNNMIECFMTNNEPHLHCLITGCEAVVASELNEVTEHLNVHEIDQGANSIIQNSTLLQITSVEGFFNRKRGRPPKNRVVEVYNNANHPPQAIFTSFKLERNNTGKKNTNTPNVEKFSGNEEKEKNLQTTSDEDIFAKIDIIQSSENCNDSACVFKNLIHLHCNVSKSCHYSTNYLSFMNIHLNEFHGQHQILPNYDYFDRNYDCKLSDCCYNKISCHYHCLSCMFSFTMPSEMNEHICEGNIEENYEYFDTIENDIMKAHQEKTKSAAFYNNKDLLFGGEQQSKEEETINLNSSDDIPNNECEQTKVSVVRAVGTWVPNNENENIHTPGDMILQSMVGSRTQNEPKNKYDKIPATNECFQFEEKIGDHYPKLSQPPVGFNQETFHTSNKPFNDAKNDLETFLSTTFQSLKDNTFSPFSGTSTTLLPFQNLQIANLLRSSILNVDHRKMLSFPSPMSTLDGNPEFSLESMVANNILGINRKHKIDELENLLTKKKPKPLERVRERKNKSYKDNIIPKGYLKFRFNQDCNFSRCGYRNHQSHFHCTRKDCSYSFCDRTRFMQHTARHERLDKLMGNDFKQFRANIPCGYQTCCYNKNLDLNNKSSHFHCLKCDYICSDTNKVVAHRRQHNKQDYIKLAGFKKISNNEHCKIANQNTPDGECPYTLKQSHYHCLVCDMAVLNHSQISFHNHQIRP